MMIIRALTAKCTPEDPLRLDRLCVEIWRGEVLESTHRARGALLMSAASGQAVCKVGGEAIRGFAIRDQTGAALGLVVKVEDGAMRALHSGCLALLERLGLIERSTLPPDLGRFVKSIGRTWAKRAATETRVQINELSESEATCA